MVLENKYKGDIKYEDLRQYPGGGYIRRGGYVGGAGEEIRLCLLQRVQEYGEGDGMSVWRYIEGEDCGQRRSGRRTTQKKIAQRRSSKRR